MHRILLLTLIGFLLAACYQTSPQDKAILSRADRLMENHPDSALHLLKTLTHPQKLSTPDHALYALLLSQAFDKCNVSIESDSLISIATDYFSHSREPGRAGYAYFYLSRCERNRENAKGQAEALLKAIPFAIKSNNQKLLGHIYNDKASIYKNQQQLDSMLYYFQLSLSAFKKGADKRNSALCLLDIGFSYSLLDDYNTALFYYKKAEQEAIPLNNPILLSSIYRFTGATFCSQLNFPLALHYLHLAALTSDSYDYNKWEIFAMVFIKTGQLDSARFYLHKSITSGYKTTVCYQLLQEIAEKQHSLTEALHYAKLASIAKDSLNKSSLTTSFAGMEKKYNYERIAANNKTLIISNQRTKIVVLVLLLGLSLIIVVTLLWITRAKQQQIKQHLALVEKEKENNILLRQQLNMQQALLKNVEHHKKITMMRLIPTKNTSLEEQKSTAENDSIALYEELIASVNALYAGFSQNLSSQFPHLTTTDILICCLFRAGFDSGMISALLDTQTDSFNVRRTRLRKKLGLNRDETFSEFLAKF
jgi:hypothetical protein